MRTGSRLADCGLAAVEAAFGVWLVYLSWGPLHHLFGGYMDNSPVVYLAIGLFFLVPGLALIWFGLRTAIHSGAPSADGRWDEAQRE